MSRVEAIRAEFVDLIPDTLQEGVLYVSRKYKTASHLCCCGCRQEVVTPLKPGSWQLSANRGKATLYPSIGNWNFPCQSHYWIRDNRIVWAQKFTQAEIDAVRRSDRRALQEHFDSPSRTWWQKVIDGILALFR